jgi:hypothetical protein
VWQDYKAVFWMPFLPPLLHSTTESSVCRTHPKKSCTCHVSHKPFSCQKVHDKKVVVANHANPLQSSSNSHLSEKFKSLNPKLRSYKSLATTDQLHSATKWELPERVKEREREMKTENLWGILFPQQKNFFNFKLMINQQKNSSPN